MIAPIKQNRRTARIPSSTEIAQRTAEIRAGWTASDHAGRAGELAYLDLVNLILSRRGAVDAVLCEKGAKSASQAT